MKAVQDIANLSATFKHNLTAWLGSAAILAGTAAGTLVQCLGATITGPQADLNMGVHTFVDSAATDPVAIDTTIPGTHSIDYVVTDAAGLTSTTTRTVIVTGPANDNQFPLSATGTSATTRASLAVGTLRLATVHQNAHPLPHCSGNSLRNQHLRAPTSVHRTSSAGAGVGKSPKEEPMKSKCWLSAARVAWH